MGAPFLPVRGILGSAYLAVNPRFCVMTDPFSGEELVAVQALTPDVTLLHGARATITATSLSPEFPTGVWRSPPPVRLSPRWRSLWPVPYKTGRSGA